LLKERDDKDCIIVAEWPKSSVSANSILQMFDVVAETITQVRNIRKSKNISPKEKISLFLKSKQEDKENLFDETIIKLCNLDAFKLTDEKIDNSISFLVKNFEFYIPFSASINIAEEKERIAKELDYNKGFLKSVQVKLANERFVQNAKPELIELERKKQADAEAKIKALEEQLKAL
jgi:valyl-tRNA synthetase